VPMRMRVAQEEKRPVTCVSPRCVHATAFQSSGIVADIG
jgi:hypothetical protein